MIRIDIDDRLVLDALRQLSRRVGDMRPAMQDIGEYLVGSTKARFATATAPDGTPWAPNRPVTIARYLGAFGGSYKKDGSLSKKGQARLGAKRPLIGESRRLGSEIHYQAGRDRVEVGSPMIYSAVQQFGAPRHSLGPHSPWGDIPARPYLGLSGDDRREIVDIVRGYLGAAL